jgi:tetratricopeptide (TPR) repeat protein
MGGDLRAAEAAFAATRERLAAATLDEPALHCEVCSLEASLRRDQRRFDEAELLLDRAVLLGRLGSDERAVAKALIQQADVLVERDEVDRAVEGLREALSLLDEESDRHLFACAIGTLTLVECERGAFAAADALLRRHRELLVGDGASWSMMRVLVLEGRIAHGLGRLADAESSFVAAHGLCHGETREYDAALIALDLAVLYAEQGRFAEVRRIARGVQPAFESREVHREATAALVLFQQAAAAERVTVEAMRSLRDVLHRRSRRRPLVDEQPS